MASYRHILLLADRELRHTPAFECARSLAQRSGASLHLAVFDHGGVVTALGLADAETARRAHSGVMAEQRLRAEGLAAELRAAGIKASASISWEYPASDAILTLIGQQQPDLIVKDVQLESAMRRLLYVPLDWDLLRRCPVPLLLFAEDAVLTPRRILAAVDPQAGSRELDDAIVREALALAMQCDAELHLATVCDAYFDLVTQATPYMPIASDSGFEMADAARQQLFTEFAASHRIPLARRHFLRGLPAPTLTEFAAGQGFDLMVLGASVHSRLEHLLMGSTARQILRHLRGSVMVVKAPHSKVVSMSASARPARG